MAYKSGEMAVNSSINEVWEKSSTLTVDHSLLEMWNTAFKNFSQNWNFGKDLPVVAYCKDLKSEKSFQASHYHCPILTLQTEVPYGF